MDQQQIKIKLSDHPWETCDCGCTMFTERIMLKRVSGLLTGQTEAQHVPVNVLLCHKCNKIPSFIASKIPGIPEELKAKPISLQL